MDRYVIVESPDTGTLVEMRVCDESELRECCAVLGNKRPFSTVRPMPVNYTPKPGLKIWRY